MRDGPRSDYPLAVTPRAKKITCVDLPGPSGSYAVIGDQLYPLDDEAAEAVAQNGMMLSLHPDYAKQLIDEGLRAAGEEPDTPRRSTGS